MKTYVLALILAVASPTFMYAQTHPSENYPGKGGNADDPNGPSPQAPEARSPSSGMQGDTTNAAPVKPAR